MQDKESAGIALPVAQQEQRTASGLILPTTKYPAKTSRAQNLLTKLVGDIKTTKTGLEVPATPLTIVDNQDQELHIASGTETLQLAAKSATANLKRTGSELALAEYNLPLFLSHEVRKRLNNDSQIYPFLDEVIANIEALTHFGPANPAPNRVNYSKGALQRRTAQTGYYDITQSKRIERVITTPGSLEAAGIAISKLIQEPGFQNELGNRIAVCLSELFENYRTQTRFGFELPEMPELVHSIADAVNACSMNNESRFGIYDMFSHIFISSDLATEVIEIMDKHNDLDHPLAYQLTMVIAEANPNHPWIKTQIERRNQLLGQLNGTSQNLFDQYNELRKLSRGLVFSGDIRHSLSGKVGMEFEYGQKQNAANQKQLQRDWVNGSDGENGEIRRSGSALEYDGAYRQSLIDLSKWFQDEATHISSLHLHFDKHRHPNRPDLGNLYKSVGGEETLRDNSLNTWEIRAMLPPFLQGKLQPARVSDAIELYLHATAETRRAAASKISISETDKPSIDRLIFGHVINHISSPQGRLALLMALHTPFMMQGVNPFAFVSSYDKSSIPAILATSARTHIDGGTRSPFIQLLELAYSTNILNEWHVNRGVDESSEQAFIRQAMESENPNNFAMQTQEIYSVAQISDKLRAGQHLTKTDLAFLYGTDDRRSYERDSRIKQILSRRNQKEDMAVIFECLPTQIAYSANEITENTRAYIGKLTPNIFRQLPDQCSHIYTSIPEGKIQKDKLMIGGMSEQDLERSVTTGRFHTSSYGLSMLRNKDFTTLEKQEEITTIRLKVSDLGFTDYPTTDELFEQAKSFGLELCPAEVGPHMRLADTKQPLDEWYYIAMKQIADSGGSPHVFELVRPTGGGWLLGGWASGASLGSRQPVSFPSPQVT